MTQHSAISNAEIDQLNADINHLRKSIKQIISAILSVEETENQKSMSDFLVYFRRSLHRLDRPQIDDAEDVSDLSELVKEIAGVATACLCLLRQGFMIEKVERISCHPRPFRAEMARRM